MTYGRIAEVVGNKKAARAVGNIIHTNRDFFGVPCYKVVSSKGKLSASYAGGGIEAEIQKSCGGVKVTSVRIPIRYPRTASSIINKKDYENMLASAEACI